MGYKVIQMFTDLQDFGHLYNVGDDFPRVGYKVSEERLTELAGVNNKRGIPLIKKVGEEKVEKAPDVEKKVEKKAITFNKTEINRMPIGELKALANENGVDNADSLSGSELKKILIKKFKL